MNYTNVTYYEKLSEDPTLTSLNYENIAEKNLALLHYKNLRKIGVAAKNIAILTCYRAQRIYSNGQRFHPNNVSYAPFPLDPKKITNNFGFNFEDFAKATNDNSMKAFCGFFIV
ncbi:unnamed protein product [Caenorhabditis brenneri]